jgi:hypothetical protein
MYADAVFLEQPDWSRGPGRRLALNLLPSTLIVAGALMMLRLPIVDQPVLLTELVVRILANEVEETAPEPPVEETATEPVPTVIDTGVTVPLEGEAIETRGATDWYSQITDAARAAAAEQAPPYSVNPGFDARRKYAAEQFAPSKAPVKRPIWENVEKDTMGRTLLRSGDCYRVLDDPNVGNRDAFQIFGQFMVTCGRSSERGRELPWVSEIRDRREGQARYGRQAAE